jgi:hypothetical protein
MPSQTIELDDFLERFADSIDGSDHGSSEYTLVLGAGASRSAGIPTAKEMNEIFKRIARHRGRSIQNPGGETDWSYLFRAAFGPDEYDNDSFEGEDYEFVGRVVSLASREPNLTNLVAASLSSMQIFPVIITTNYDDLLLAGFWNLPPGIRYSEPHVIYNPRDKFSQNPLFGPTAPVVIKAHGHHTDYNHGIGILDHQIKELAPYVRKAIKRQARPRVGYIVVGYSGDWQDGIMEAFKDRSLMAQATVYWFFRDKPPTRIASEIWRTANIYFVHCSDSDFLFLNMWYEVTFILDAPSLEPGELFGPLLLKDRKKRVQPVDAQSSWWNPERPKTLGELPDAESRRLLHLEALAEKILPILDQCDDWEERRIIDRCLPGQVKRASQLDEDTFEDEDPPALKLLKEAIPARVSWGRRDRRLLRLALHPEANPMISKALLEALAEFD